MGVSKEREEREGGEEGDVGWSVGGEVGEVGRGGGREGKEAWGSVMASCGGGVPADRKSSVPYGTWM